MQEPLVLRQPSDLTNLVAEMKKAAQEYPCNEEQHYSNNETEVIETSRQGEGRSLGEWQCEVGLARALVYKDGRSLVSLCLSLETFTEEPQYRLSMCRLTGPTTFASVPQEDADMLARAFFGNDAEAVVNPSGIENAKHYICRRI